MKKKKDKKEEFNYQDFEKEAIERLKSGKGLIGEGGVFTEMIGRILKAAYEGEMEDHLNQSEPGTNRRNGHTKKKIKTDLGPVEVSPPRDRNGEYEPQIVKKWERSLAPEIENQIISLYAMGTSYLDISAHIEKMYGMKYSPSFITSVTNRVYDEIEVWKSRPLDDFYALIYLDAIHFKVRENRQVQTKAVYTVLGVNTEGERDVLGLYIGESEGARYWGRILENIRDRGVKDVLFFCVDGLKGFKEVIEGVYPRSVIQRCIVHMVRTSIRYVAYNDYKPICKDLRKIYTKDNAESAHQELQRFKHKWRDKYPGIAKKWEDNWLELSPFFDYTEPIRRVIYTTNAVESLHRTLRKVTKTKGAFIHENALEKQLYLALKYNQRSWKRKVRGWPLIFNSLKREFTDRIPEELL